MNNGEGCIDDGFNEGPTTNPNDPANLFPDTAMNTGGSTKGTMQLQFGPETLQDDKMQLLGMGLNVEHKAVICSICHIAVPPKKLYDHFGLANHHPAKDFQTGQRLSFFTRSFCTKFIKDHQLPEAFETPKTIIEAIPGLTVRLEMMTCSHCGYAAVTNDTLVRHRKNCAQGQTFKGPAQSFNASRIKENFGVKLPPPSDPNPLDAALLFHQQFASDPYTALPIQASCHPRELDIFLAQENWLGEVVGMTGQEITELARKARPDLRERVKESVLRYALSVVTELQGTESAIRLAMGDYNKCVCLQFPPITELLKLKSSSSGHSTSWFRAVDDSTQKRYSNIVTDMILFSIGLALKNFKDFHRPVSSALKQAAEEYVATLGSNKTDEDRMLQEFLYELFTQERSGSNQYSLIVYLFLILYSFCQEGHLAKAGIITQYISAIVFFGRGAIFKAIGESIESTNEGFFS